jgi:hypothetical protein
MIGWPRTGGLALNARKRNTSRQGRFANRPQVCGRLTVLGGCGQDNVVGLSRTQFLADVGFKLRECEARLRRKIFSAAESRSGVVVTARPEDPELPSIRGAILCRILPIGKRCATREGVRPENAAWGRLTNPFKGRTSPDQSSVGEAYPIGSTSRCVSAGIRTV